MLTWTLAATAAVLFSVQGLTTAKPFIFPRGTELIEVALPNDLKNEKVGTTTLACLFKDSRWNTTTMMAAVGMATSVKTKYSTDHYYQRDRKSWNVYDGPILCPLPPEIKDAYGTGDIEVSLSKVYAVTPLILFDCGDHTDCRTCTTSKYSCHWCPSTGSCYNTEHSFDKQCSAENQPVYNQKSSLIGRKGPEECPNWRMDGKKQLFVSAGTTKQLRVRLQNVETMKTSEIACQFKIDDQVIQVPGQLIHSWIVCDKMKFDYPSTTQANLTGTMDVFWSNGLKLDNPDSVHVVIFKCDLAAASCTDCFNLPLQAQCGWSSEKQKCIHGLDANLECENELISTEILLNDEESTLKVLSDLEKLQEDLVTRLAQELAEEIEEEEEHGEDF